MAANLYNWLRFKSSIYCHYKSSMIVLCNAHTYFPLCKIEINTITMHNYKPGPFLSRIAGPPLRPLSARRRARLRGPCSEIHTAGIKFVMCFCLNCIFDFVFEIFPFRVVIIFGTNKNYNRGVFVCVRGQVGYGVWIEIKNNGWK